MRKLFVILMVCMLSLSLSACGFIPYIISDSYDDNAYQEEYDREETIVTGTKPLTIVDSGYSLDTSLDELNINYSIVIKNPNTNAAIIDPCYLVLAKDKAGKILNVEQGFLSEIQPGATVADASSVMRVAEKPATVDFQIIDIEGAWVTPASTYFPNMQPLTVTNINYIKHGTSGTIKGEIINPNRMNFEAVTLTILFKDKNDKLIGGESFFIDSVNAHDNTWFNEKLYTDIPVDHCAAYAMPEY